MELPRSHLMLMSVMMSVILLGKEKHVEKGCHI